MAIKKTTREVKIRKQPLDNKGKKGKLEKRGEIEGSGDSEAPENSKGKVAQKKTSLKETETNDKKNLDVEESKEMTKTGTEKGIAKIEEGTKVSTHNTLKKYKIDWILYIVMIILVIWGTYNFFNSPIMPIILAIFILSGICYLYRTVKFGSKCKETWFDRLTKTLSILLFAVITAQIAFIPLMSPRVNFDFINDSAFINWNGTLIIEGDIELTLYSAIIPLINCVSFPFVPSDIENEIEVTQSGRVSSICEVKGEENLLTICTGVSGWYLPKIKDIVHYKIKREKGKQFSVLMHNSGSNVENSVGSFYLILKNDYGFALSLKNYRLHEEDYNNNKEVFITALRNEFEKNDIRLEIKLSCGENKTGQVGYTTDKQPGVYNYINKVNFLDISKEPNKVDVVINVPSIGKNEEMECSMEIVKTSRQIVKQRLGFDFDGGVLMPDEWLCYAGEGDTDTLVVDVINTANETITNLSMEINEVRGECDRTILVPGGKSSCTIMNIDCGADTSGEQFGVKLSFKYKLSAYENLRSTDGALQGGSK